MPSGILSEAYSAADMLNRTVNFAIVAADPKLRAKVIKSSRSILREGIVKDYGHIIDIAPTMNVIPIRSLPGKEKETLDNLRESIKWAQEQNGVESALVYQLVSPDTRGDAPTYVAVISTEDKEVMQNLRNSPRAPEFQKILVGLSGGKSATDAGVRQISSLLIDM